MNINPWSSCFLISTSALVHSYFLGKKYLLNELWCLFSAGCSSYSMQSRWFWLPRPRLSWCWRQLFLLSVCRAPFSLETSSSVFWLCSPHRSESLLIILPLGCKNSSRFQQNECHICSLPPKKKTENLQALHLETALCWPFGPHLRGHRPLLQRGSVVSLLPSIAALLGVTLLGQWDEGWTEWADLFHS